MISGSVEPKALLIEDVRNDPEFSIHEAAELSPNIRSFIGVPVTLLDGTFFGTLCAVDPEPQKVLTRQQADLMSVLARLVATQIERQRAEEKLRLRDRAIAASSDGIVITDPNLPDNPIIYANEGFLRTTGYGADEVIGRNCRFLQGQDRDQPELDELRAAIREGRECRVVLRNYKKDGTLFWNELSISPVYDETGRLINHIEVQNDITERKRVEEMLRESQEALAREVRAKSDFLADVSHELRTPLTVIRGNAEVGVELGREWAHADLLEEIVKESAMMSRMVEDLLFLARSDSDSLPLELRTVPVARLNDGLARRAEVLVRKHGASLKLALCGQGSLRCDPERIEQAVLVLIDNAAKYGPPGGQITLSSSTRADELQIEVADRGPGIAPEELPRVFERFYRCKNSSGEPGSGLGLPIAKTIVKGHGGRIGAASEVGEGTRVSLCLPLINGI